ncbi:hypothetical protein ACN20G_33260 (plasmid) [Streptomyces sp. BI20]|uniref:hypothetical protein n=1 Tax=Streptomyces sp. BI20 TaxID=3403460 RepID=UPI003C783FC4
MYFRPGDRVAYGYVSATHGLAVALNVLVIEVEDSEDQPYPELWLARPDGALPVRITADPRRVRSLEGIPPERQSDEVLYAGALWHSVRSVARHRPSWPAGPLGPVVRVPLSDAERRDHEAQATWHAAVLWRRRPDLHALLLRNLRAAL